jgi:hypothetical protein
MQEQGRLTDPTQYPTFSLSSYIHQKLKKTPKRGGFKKLWQWTFLNNVLTPLV